MGVVIRGTTFWSNYFSNWQQLGQAFCHPKTFHIDSRSEFSKIFALSLPDISNLFMEDCLKFHISWVESDLYFQFI